MGMNALAVFDLDDTLIDTSGLLVPAALQAVADAIGRNVSELVATGKTADEVLGGLELDPGQRRAAAEAWYDPRVPPMDLLPGAHAMLQALSGRIALALLTRGDPVRQNAKIDACGLRGRFDAIAIRDVHRGGSKADDLRAMFEEFDVAPSRVAVIGDDPRDELRHAADLGCLALRVPDVSLSGIPDHLEKAGLLRPPC